MLEIQKHTNLNFVYLNLKLYVIYYISFKIRLSNYMYKYDDNKITCEKKTYRQCTYIRGIIGRYLY